jgi:hypothetical protein
MSGVANATLEGWAVPTLRSSKLDHTYVVSSCGLRWDCRGQGVGGKLLRSGTGNSAIANCLSQTNSGAAIQYGVTGVCHQRANRILYPAGVTVAGCQGYPKSVFTWGIYGLFPWPERNKCYIATTSTLNTRQVGADAMTKIGVYNETVSKIPAEFDKSGDAEACRLAELHALVELTLDQPLEKPTFDVLADNQKRLQVAQADLADRFKAGQLRSEDYMSEFAKLMEMSLEANRLILGEDRFKLMFGDTSAEGLIDPETFLREHRDGR